MAEIIAIQGDTVRVSGTYACSECGHRIELSEDDVFPPDHDPEKPWTLMVASGPLP